MLQQNEPDPNFAKKFDESTFNKNDSSVALFKEASDEKGSMGKLSKRSQEKINKKSTINSSKHGKEKSTKSNAKKSEAGIVERDETQMRILFGLRDLGTELKQMRSDMQVL